VPGDGERKQEWGFEIVFGAQRCGGERDGKVPRVLKRDRNVYTRGNVGLEVDTSLRARGEVNTGRGVGSDLAERGSVPGS